MGFDGNDAADRLLVDRFEGRGDLLPRYRSALAAVSRHCPEDAVAAWTQACLRLSDANAGPGLFAMLWQLEQRAGASLSPDPCLLALPVLRLCRHAGAVHTRGLLQRLAEISTAQTDAPRLADLLEPIAEGAKRHADIVPALIGVLEQLTGVGGAGLRGWIEDGLRLGHGQRRRRQAYFRLDDPLSRQRLAWHSGTMSFRQQEKRLGLVTRLLWNEELVLADLPEGTARTRLAGGRLIVPPLVQDVPAALTDAFAEAAVMHAQAHRRFTRYRFDGKRIKPLQMALVCLIEDARVERLAADRYPGLARLWARFSRPPEGRARTAQALLQRLAHALSHGQDDEPDGWIGKGKALFESAFREAPHDQFFCERIGRILGHDLGQMGIPFDPRVYRIEPAYRDDGLGLFDFDADDGGDPETQLLLDSARLDLSDTDDGDLRGEAERTEAAKARPMAEDEEIGPLLAEYPEWDYRIRSDQHAKTRVFLETLPSPSSGRLHEDLRAGRAISRQLAAQIQRSRLGSPQRLRRQQDGDDLDIDALHELIVAQRASGLMDMKIHQLRRRTRSDISVALVLDASQSTGDGLADGRSILETAALAVALLAEALHTSQVPFAIYGFRSDGADQVRISTIKAFDEEADPAFARLGAIEPALSTRLGAALRHAARCLDPCGSHRKLLLAITDGEPSDIDVTDPRYLVEDARCAVQSARSSGIDAFCVSLGDRASLVSRAIFGARNTLDVTRIEELPLRLSHLYYRLTVA